MDDDFAAIVIVAASRSSRFAGAGVLVHAERELTILGDEHGLAGTDPEWMLAIYLPDKFSEVPLGHGTSAACGSKESEDPSCAFRSSLGNPAPPLAVGGKHQPVSLPNRYARRDPIFVAWNGHLLGQDEPGLGRDTCVRVLTLRPDEGPEFFRSQHRKQKEAQHDDQPKHPAAWVLSRLCQLLYDFAWLHHQGLCVRPACIRP